MTLSRQSPIPRVDDLDLSAKLPSPLDPYQKVENLQSNTQNDTHHDTPIAVEIIRALTPLALAAIGCILGVAVLMSDSTADDNARTAGFGLASTAIAGAAGLAQTSNRKD